MAAAAGRNDGVVGKDSHNGRWLSTTDIHWSSARVDLILRDERSGCYIETSGLSGKSGINGVSPNASGFAGLMDAGFKGSLSVMRRPSTETGRTMNLRKE